VSTAAEVGSTGTDDQRFEDHQLTPGPADKPLREGNTYAVLWVGAFARAGSATLKVTVARAFGNSASSTRTVTGKKGDVFTRLILIPSA
jgi:hypothetical protein